MHAILLVNLGKQMNINGAPNFHRIDFVVIPSDIERPNVKFS